MDIYEDAFPHGFDRIGCPEPRLLLCFDQSTEQTRKQRIVARLPLERNEPLRIRAVRVNGVQVSHRLTFRADDDWLDALTITVTNRTQKNIVYAAIDLQFPDNWDRTVE